MGHFSNGTEGDIFQEQYCDKCVHLDKNGGCPAFNAHFLYQEEKNGTVKAILNMLIKRNDKTHQQECVIFHEKYM